MTDEELTARLRKYEDDLLSITADRIEALTKEREQWRRAAETRAEGWKISDDARIEAEIKLAKAVEAAFYEGFCEGRDGGWVWGDPTPAWKKSDAFAELTGGKDD